LNPFEERELNFTLPPEPPTPDPLVRDLLQRIARASTGSVWQLGVEQARRAYVLGAALLAVAPPPLHEVIDLDCPTRDGRRLPLRRYRPFAADGETGALLYLHGGGFVIGSIATHDALCRQLALQAGCDVYALDYRLAPEHRFPTAVHDAADALQWLREHAAMLGLEPRRLAVGGDSAGGTLATVCALLERDAGRSLALQLLFYPGTAGIAQTASARQFAHGYLLEREDVDWFFGQYLRNAEDARDWRFAPLLAPDLRGVAPAWIGLAGCDILHDEGVQYAQRLRDSGVAVELREWPGAMHDFIRMDRVLPHAAQAVQAAAAALRHALQNA
jgi:acetyl esterase